MDHVISVIEAPAGAGTAFKSTCCPTIFVSVGFVTLLSSIETLGAMEQAGAGVGVAGGGDPSPPIRPVRFERNCGDLVEDALHDPPPPPGSGDDVGCGVGGIGVGAGDAVGTAITPRRPSGVENIPHGLRRRSKQTR